MNEFRINIPAGQNKRLLTGGTYCPDDILVTVKHHAPIEEKDVNFWDYDGTLLYSYTLEEAQALTELPRPATPKYDFLKFTNWNWELDSIKAYGKAVDVGAIYTTADGSTYFFADIASDALKCLTLHFIQTVSDSVSVDWGDDSAAETVSGTGAVSISHEYAVAGRYIIRLSVMAGTVTLGWDDDTNSLLGDDSNANRPVKARMAKVFVGSSAAIGRYAFWQFSGMTEITIPENTAIGNAAFSTCRGLTHLNAPRSLTSLPNLVCASAGLHIFAPGDNVQLLSANAVIYCNGLRRGFAMPNITTLGYGTYYQCSSITRVDIGEKVTTIGGSALVSAQSVVELTLPTLVSSIAAAAFFGMRGLRKLRFLPTTPPAAANSNAFSEIPTNCVVEVPAESLAAYQTATNYASLAAQMVGV